jgi:hypothetical protein
VGLVFLFAVVEAVPVGVHAHGVRTDLDGPVTIGRRPPVGAAALVDCLDGPALGFVAVDDPVAVRIVQRRMGTRIGDEVGFVAGLVGGDSLDGVLLAVGGTV